MDLRASKAQLRRDLAARRSTLSAGEAEAAARAVAKRVSATPEFASAARIALYAALEGELPTAPLFAAARRRGKVTLLPRVASDERLEFAVAERWDELRPGRYGVLEPPPGDAVPMGPADLALLPGLAFDRRGARLGRGGGHYDRAFPPAARGTGSSPVLFGLAYEFQVIALVPEGPGDRRVDAVATERALHRAPLGERDP